MKAKLIGRLIMGCVFACCLSQNILYAQPILPGGGSGGGTNSSNPYAGFNATQSFSYPTNGVLKWSLTMQGYTTFAQPSLSADGILYAPVASGQSLWAINPLLVDTNDSAYPAPDNFVNWVFGFGEGPPQYTPTIDAYGTVFTYYTINASNRQLVALNPTNGVPIWTFTISDLPGPTAVGNDGTVYCVGGNYICALTNALGFTTNFQITVSPFYVVHFALTNVGIKWLNYDTTDAQRFGNPVSRPCQPVIGPEGNIYCRTPYQVFAINSTNGSVLWQTTNQLLSGYAPAPPSIGFDGIVYYGQGTNLFAVNPKAIIGTNGIMPFKWVYRDILTNTIESFDYSPVIGNNGTIYIESFGYSVGSNALWAFNSLTGAVEWKLFLNSTNPYYGANWKCGSLALASDGEIYVADDDGTFYSVSPSGNINWLYQTDGGGALGCPLVAPDGTVYVLCQNGGYQPGILYAFAGNSPIACSAWPEFGRNARRTSTMAFTTSSSPIAMTNGFKFTISGFSNSPVCACASSDLTTWTNLGQTILTGGSTNFVDIGATNYSYRFYRAMPQ